MFCFVFVNFFKMISITNLSVEWSSHTKINESPIITLKWNTADDLLINSGNKKSESMN